MSVHIPIFVALFWQLPACKLRLNHCCMHYYSTVIWSLQLIPSKITVSILTWYIHVHTMYAHVWYFLTCMYMLNTCLYHFPNSVQVVRIPDVGYYWYYWFAKSITIIGYYWTTPISLIIGINRNLVLRLIYLDTNYCN